MQGFGFFVQLAPGQGPVGKGRSVATTKDGSHVILEFFGKPPLRRVLPWSALSNFLFFASAADVEAFLTPPAANDEQSSRPEAQNPSGEAAESTAAAPPAEANKVVPLRADD